MTEAQKRLNKYQAGSGIETISDTVTVIAGTFLFCSMIVVGLGVIFSVQLLALTAGAGLGFFFLFLVVGAFAQIIDQNNAARFQILEDSLKRSQGRKK